MIQGFVGTYTKEKSKGIYSFQFDTELQIFHKSNLYREVDSPKYLSYENGRLAYPCKKETAQLAVYDGKQEVCIGNENSTACYVTQDDTYLYSVNYHDGTLIRYRYTTSLEIDQTVCIGKNAGSHQAILEETRIFVPCRLLDEVRVYDRTTLQQIATIPFPKGTGIRHGVIGKQHNALYLISEDSFTLYEIDLSTYEVRNSIAMLGEVGGSGAAIRLSKDERYLYVSERKWNEIYVIETKECNVIQKISSGGDHPRDIALSIKDDYLFVANKDSNNLVAFQRNQENGCLKQTARTEDIPEGVSIVFQEVIEHEE